MDVSTKEAEMTQVLSEAAEQWLRNCRARAVADEEAVDMDQETIDEFRALGYFN